jgi:hypothetical protein
MKNEEAFLAYLGAALWSSTDDDDRPFDDNYGIVDIGQETIDDARKDVDKFMGMIGDVDISEGQIVHDFWLTRNGHGAGFWDRGYNEDLEKLLMDATKNFSELWMYVGDDGEVWIS